MPATASALGMRRFRADDRLASRCWWAWESRKLPQSGLPGGAMANPTLKSV